MFPGEEDKIEAGTNKKMFLGESHIGVSELTVIKKRTDK